jgi:hypothetical protein
MRRLMAAVVAVPLVLLLGVAPVAADTTGGGGSGTHFGSFSETCSTSSGRQVCTDTNLNVDPNGDGTSSGCLDIFTYSVSAKGRFTFMSDNFGCNPDVSLTVGSDFSVALDPSVISMQTCAAHKRSCSGGADVTVSASDSLVGDISTTTTRSTTVSGGCTFKTTTKETFGDLAGTMTVDAATLDEQGFVDIVDETSTVRCK